MSYQRERDQFIATMTREGLPLYVTELLLREATGIHRRAEFACSSEAADRDRVPCPAMPRINNKGDRYPGPGPCLCDAVCSVCDRGYQTLLPHSADASCSACGADWVPKHQRITRIAVQDWRAEERIEKALGKVNAANKPTPPAIAPWTMLTQGDPRG